MFVKRVGRFMKALFLSLNADTFVALDSIEDPLVSGEEFADVDRTIRVMEMQGHVEVATDENGFKSLRLTPSGVVLKSTIEKGAV